MDDFPDFSLHFDFLRNDNFYEDVPDDLIMSIEETWLKDSATAGEDASTEIINNLDNKAKKATKEKPSEKRFAEVSTADIDKIVDNAESKRTKYQTK